MKRGTVVTYHGDDLGIPEGTVGRFMCKGWGKGRAVVRFMPRGRQHRTVEVDASDLLRGGGILPGGEARYAREAREAMRGIA